jgi:hypothetical protein
MNGQGGGQSPDQGGGQSPDRGGCGDQATPGAIEELLVDAQGEDPDGLDIFVGLNQLDDDDVPFLIADMEALFEERGDGAPLEDIGLDDMLLD